MSQNLNFLKRTFGICIFLLCYHFSIAGVLPFNERIYTASPSSPVTIGLPSATKLVNVSVAWTGSFTDVSVIDRITLGVDHQNIGYVTLAGEVKVKLKLEQWLVTNTTSTPSTITYPELTINYQPFSNTTPYIDKSVFTFNDAYKYRITIDDITQNGTSITTLPSNLFIDADISVERYEDFSTNASTPIVINSITSSNLLDHNCDGINDEVELTWNPISGAEEYQLEWTFVNDYGTTLGPPYKSPSTLKYDFKNNSTRITKTETNHKLTLTFEHGYLLYRVRGIGRELTDPTKNIIGVWNVADNGIVSSVSSIYYNTQEHEADKNWQYSATYAEEGKKKEVVSYFDGSLRNRQSVTKVNSDNNTIVGETIYDYQGRPAINVLPVPVNDPTCTSETPLKYYPNFNRDDSTDVHSYGRDDFDVDASSSNPCVATTGAMNTASGASNYYSPFNPDKNDVQAFVPDGEKYPFTQIEYTPDNTGRIRRQSGVGPEYQLGEGHETKYFYGFPNQIQLDRLFGSEVGDAGHYKKNVVIDANGQVSVSYLDQEGRTIATALAGNAPKAEDNSTTILAPLESEGAAQKQLEIDLFAKNALGQSSVNVKNITPDAIEFNSQLLVAYESEYDFKYVLSIEQLTDPCLRENICFSCVYDLEIKVTDDCGQSVAPISGTGVQPVSKTVGYFTSDGSGNVVSFNRDCNGSAPFTQTESFKLNLPVGNYTISKVLTVNSSARDFYVATYIDSVYNSCVKTLYDFQQDELANIDTADCNITCESCKTSLMTVDGTVYTTVAEARDAYVAAGKGTEMEFDYLLEECGAPCKTITWCEATYQQMLLDVSPDGQYAQFQTTVGGQAPDLLLSVLNVSNVLPKSVAGVSAHWQNPQIKINGTNYSKYLEEDGTRSIIHLSPNGSNFIPAVVNTSSTHVKFDATGNFYYTYPENLSSVQDFVDNWVDNWAKSLVQYHPEYCYYETCAEYSKIQSGDPRSSDALDSILLSTNTYADAVSKGLILSSYTTTPPSPATSDIRKMARFVYPSGTINDPFLFNTSVYSTYGPLLLNKVTNYQTLGSGSYSMVEMAAITARCGTTYGTTPVSATCKSFGKDVGTDPVENTRVRDLEWNFLRNFYLSEKHKVQHKRADDYSKLVCKGYNGCIGNTDYNPYISGMVSTFSGSSYFTSEYFNDDQPCSIYFKDLYKNKVKRFISPDDIHSPSPAEMDYQMYLQTGQCPLAIDYQYLLSSLASHNQLDNTTGENLQTYGEFTNDLYIEVSGGVAPSSFVPYTWSASTTGNVLTGNIVNSLTSSPACSFTLDKTGTGIVNWDDIIGISQLSYTSTVGGNYEFTAIATVMSTSGAVSYKTITGSTCVKITGCNFPPQCDANDLANDLSALMSALQINNHLSGTTDLDISSSQYKAFLTPSIKNALGTTNTTLKWSYNSGANQYEIFDSSAPLKKLILKFNTFTPNTFNNLNLFPTVKTFTGIQSNYQNFFIIHGVDASNASVVTIDGSITYTDGITQTGLSMGSCGLPEAIGCQETENQIREDLQALLKDVLLKRPFTGNIDLTQSAYYTSLIQSYFPDSLVSTSSVNPHQYVAGVYSDSLIFTIHSQLGDCKMLLYHHGPKPPRYFGDLIGFGSQLTPYGSTGADGNYYKFYAVGIYSVGGSSFKDTIWGESCLPLKICTPCLQGADPSCVSCEELKLIPPLSVCKNQAAVFDFETIGCSGSPDLLWNYGDGTVSSLASHVFADTGTYTVTLSTIRTPECSGVPTLVASVTVIVNDCSVAPSSLVQPIYYNRLDSVAIANGTKVQDSTLTSYSAYSTKLDSLNTTYNWSPSDTTYVAATDYSSFYVDGYKYSLTTYNEFIANYDSTIDNKNYLRDPKAFIVAYGPYTNCKEEYVRYVNAINKYNNRAVAYGVSQLTALADSSFNSNILCDSIKRYISYLKEFPANGLAPLTELAFFAARNSLPSPTDQCAILYKQYASAYKVFEANQQTTNSCKEYKTISPLYSYDDFVKNGLCSSGAGITLFNNYIQLFLTASSCPGSMPKAGSATSIDDKTCQRLYSKYKNTINSYNTSAYAVAHGHTISILYTSYTLFKKAELCNCVGKYIAYLEPYLTEPATSALALPVDIDHFADCAIPAAQPTDPCATAYNDYLTAIAEYNEYVLLHPELKLPQIKDIYKETDFTADGFCYCVDAYEAYLEAIINGTASVNQNRTEGFLQLDIAYTCNETITPPCDPAMPQDTVVSPAYTPYTNPCVQYQIDLAYANAQNAYNQYVDSLTTWISGKYNEHCLKAFEAFATKYQDKEYHFTLYYYDQAGNLVRTIPPQGVNVDPMTDTTDLHYKQINKDRTYSQHTFFTDHTMATTYEYNSLNQLVRQNMPDHDAMDVWEFTLPNGLDSRLKVTATQFVNANKGYLSGYVDIGSGSGAYKRGYVYTTDNGGATWTKMNDLLGSDLKKVQMIDANNGFAVGSNGILVSTVDGGTTWDLKQQRYFENAATFNDLFFVSSVNGVIVGDKGVNKITTDGGTTFSNAGLPNTNTFNYTSVTYDGTNFYASRNNSSNTESEIYKGVVSGTFTITWTLVNSIRSTDLTKIQMVAGNDGYAIGTDGTLLKTTDNGGTWKTIATNTADKFKDLYFTNMNEGVAIIDSMPGYGLIFKTINGGQTWTLLGTHNGDYYNSFNFYDGTKGYAVADNNKMKRVVMTGSYGLVNIPAPATSAPFKIKAASFNNAGDKGFIVGDNATIYYTLNGTSSSPTWVPVNTGLSGADANFKDIYFGSVSSASNNTGILLGENGKVYKITSTPAGGTTYSIALISSAGSNIVDIDDNNGSSGAVYAYDKTSGTLKSIIKANIPTATSLTTLSNTGTLPASTNIVSIDVKNNTTIFVTGSNGDIFRGDNINTGTVAWVEQSKNVIALPLNDLQAAGGNTIYAVGEQGSLLQTINGSDWKTLETKAITTFNAIKFNTANNAAVAGTKGLIVGNNGFIANNTISGSTATLVPIAVPSSVNFYDVALNTSNKAYVAGANGTLVSIPTIFSPVASIAALQPAEAFHGICYRIGTNQVYAIGDNAAVYSYNNLSGAKIKSVFTPGLADVNFVNPLNGYTVGEKDIIRHTNDGGLTWKYVAPINSTGVIGSIPQVNGVYTYQADKAIIIGNNGYVGKVTGIAVAYYSIGTTNNLFDVAVKNTTAYIVGQGGVAFKSTNTGVTFSAMPAPPTTTTLRALHMFNDATMIAVGNQRRIYYFNGTSWITHAAPTSIPSGVIFTDVYFHDDRTGYVVGSGGAGVGSYVLRCSLNANIQGLSGTTASWTEMPLTGINGVPAPSNVDVVTIDFASRYNGFLGGSFNTGTPVNFARLINDESKMFSTRFWYDRLGRMVVSQNSKQYKRKEISTPVGLADYSYTVYDELGRIAEVGELSDNAGASTNFSTIFGEYVNGLYNPFVINDTKLAAWISGSNRREVTKTYYDNTVITGLPITQENIRKRVASVTYEDVFDSNDQTFQHATHYTYDIHGNVKTLIQDNKKLYDQGVAASSTTLQNQRFKRIDYDYDLISGKVNLVRYQDGQHDAFYHFYAYDADNRITDVYTSRFPQANTLINWNTVINNTLWDLDAHYIYYDHGPLARVEYGSIDNKVQGTDYTYTLQGWIKGVNSNLLKAENDMGADGLTASINAGVAKDAFGYTLNYHANDYKPIDGLKWSPVTQRFEAVIAGSDLNAERYDLFNGNISSMVTTIMEPKVYTIAANEYPIILPQGTAYKYDQLNRLLEMKAYTNLDMNTSSSTFNTWLSGSTYNGSYHNTFKYDANGNILGQLRANQSGTVIDSLTYKYAKDALGKMRQNRLYDVNDNVTATAFADDIDDQGGFNASTLSGANYNYDEIGNLIKDGQEQIDKITWTVYGKIKTITRATGSLRSDLEFNYDASGNRISKVEKPRDASGVKPASEWITTYYSRDAQGNVMTIYKHTPVTAGTSFKVIERNIYGSSRLGSDYTEVELVSVLPTANPYTKTLGNKHYEGSNHLGNVMVVITDRKIGVDNNTDGTTDYYLPDVVSATDYYSSHMIMPGRSYNSNAYRYGGSNGQERDDEITGAVGSHYTAEYWEYDSRLGRRWNIDPVVKPWESSYATFANNPILFMDPNGLDPVTRLSKGERFKNWIKGDGYLNKANKYAVDNKIDDSQISYGKGRVGSVTINESYYTLTTGHSQSGEMTGSYQLNEKSTTFTDGNTFGTNKPLRLWGFQIANQEGQSWADKSPVESAGAYADVSYKFGHFKTKTEIKYIGTTDTDETFSGKTSAELGTSSASIPEVSAGTGLVFKFGPSRSSVVTGNIGANVGFLNFGYNPVSREFKIGVQISTKPMKETFKPKIEAGVKLPDTKLFEIKD